MHLSEHRDVDFVTTKLWNVEIPLGPGGSGMDVKLLQYLLYTYSYLKDDGAYELYEVDGIWGSRTSAALAVLENDRDSAAVADGYVTPLPPLVIADGGHGIGPGGYYAPKLMMLQYYYTQVRTGAEINYIGSPLLGPTVLAMPDDGVCPGDLASALRAVLAEG